MVSKFKDFIKRNEKYVPPVAIFGGFVLDAFTLGTIDNLFGQILLGSYLFIIAILIILINLIDSNKIRRKFIVDKRIYVDFLLMFLFGNIFSGFTIFYFQSVGGFANWIFIILLFGLLISTEYFKKYYNRMIVQIFIFYFAFFSYLIFLVPLVFKQIGVVMFLLSGVLSLFVFYFYLIIFQKFVKIKFDDIKKIIKGVSGVFLLVNLFYFFNIIPPVPLAIKEIDIYHDVKRSKDAYEIKDEKTNLFSYLGFYETKHIRQGDKLFAYSSVFAPAKINMEVYYEWEYRNDKGKWETVSKSPYPIIGGSKSGYRSFAYRIFSQEGRWRVKVKTKSGQIIGGKTFKVVFDKSVKDLTSFAK
jgi:hypothetical protein